MTNQTKNLRETMIDIIKKNLPEKKEVKRGKYCNDCGEQIGYDRSTKMYFCPRCPFLNSDKTNQKSKDVNAFNKYLSQINTSLIADEVLKVFREQIEDLPTLYNSIEHLISKDDILDLLDNLSPNKENKN